MAVPMTGRRVIHVPYAFSPGSLGGTEVYVQALARELQAFGWSSTIAAPGPGDSESVADGQSVVRLAHGDPPDAAYFVPDRIMADRFDALLERLAPQVVHLHARSSAVSELLLNAARQRGVATVVTYHTPTMSCPRGTMLLYGRTPCDGRLELTRCTDCALRSHGVPAAAAIVLARAPGFVSRFAEYCGLHCGPGLALRMRTLVAGRIARFHDFMRAADRVVAVCAWVEDVLRINGVDMTRTMLSRQGLAHAVAEPTSPADPEGSGPLRIGYFGRLDQTKGIDTLIEAVRAAAAPVHLTVHGVSQAESPTAFETRLLGLAGDDPRIRFAPAVEPSAIGAAMAAVELVAVPSIWLETGPLVVLEAFAAGRPVLGSNRGGIAELVRPGIDGVLVAPGDTSAWTRAIENLAEDRSRVAAMARNILPVRTMGEVAADMDRLYRSLPVRAA